MVSRWIYTGVDYTLILSVLVGSESTCRSICNQHICLGVPSVANEMLQVLTGTKSGVIRGPLLETRSEIRAQIIRGEGRLINSQLSGFDA